MTPEPSTGLRRPNASQWETIKPIFRRLYLVEGKQLKAVRQELKTKHNFDVSKTGLTRKISEWGLFKNMKAAEKERLEAQRMSLKGQGNMVGTIDWEKVDRHCRDSHRKLRRQVQRSNNQRQEAYTSVLGWRYVPCQSLILTGDDKAIGLAVEFCRWTVFTTLPKFYTTGTSPNWTMSLPLVTNLASPSELYEGLLEMRDAAPACLTQHPSVALDTLLTLTVPGRCHSFVTKQMKVWVFRMVRRFALDELTQDNRFRRLMAELSDFKRLEDVGSTITRLYTDELWESRQRYSPSQFYKFWIFELEPWLFRLLNIGQTDVAIQRHTEVFQKSAVIVAKATALESLLFHDRLTGKLDGMRHKCEQMLSLLGNGLTDESGLPSGDNFNIYEELALCYTDLGDYDAALVARRTQFELMKKGPDLGWYRKVAYDGLIEALEEQEKWDELQQMRSMLAELDYVYTDTDYSYDEAEAQERIHELVDDDEEEANNEEDINGKGVLNSERNVGHQETTLAIETSTNNNTLGFSTTSTDLVAPDMEQESAWDELFAGNLGLLHYSLI